MFEDAVVDVCCVCFLVWHSVTPSLHWFWSIAPNQDTSLKQT